MAAPPAITAAVESVSPSMWTNTECMLTSRPARHRNQAITPFISTPQAATHIMGPVCTGAGCVFIDRASIEIYTEMPTSVIAFRKAASTPALW